MRVLLAIVIPVIAVVVVLFLVDAVKRILVALAIRRARGTLNLEQSAAKGANEQAV